MLEDEIVTIIENISEYKNLKENLNIDLLESNILDSLAFIELITQLPTLVPTDTWRSIKGISKLVEELRKNK